MQLTLPPPSNTHLLADIIGEVGGGGTRPFHAPGQTWWVGWVMLAIYLIKRH